MRRGSLKILWFAAFVVIFFAFIAYSAMLPLFGDQTEKAWQWLLPNLLPPFGIVFGLELAAKASGKQADPAAAPHAPAPTPAQGGWALAMSMVYLGALLISAFGVLFVTDPIAFLNMSNYWLAPLLTVTTAMLGAQLVKSA